MFQFTLPHGERPQSRQPANPRGCFNSRSRMGSDLTSSVSSWPASVSIHAPAWGATGVDSNRKITLFCFNSRSRMGSDPKTPRPPTSPRRFQFTLPHGERRGASATSTTAGRFQFTLPHGERPLRLARPAGLHRVSIHAPAWGATSLAVFAEGRDGVSIHAPAWGATTLRSLSSLPTVFQFTLPHGERRDARMGGLPPRRFNSRSRMGSDLASWLFLLFVGEFQFTLPHGERLDREQALLRAEAFQFTLPHGERLRLVDRSLDFRRFNSRSRMGSDIWPGRPRSARLCFNSRSRMGSDLSVSSSIIVRTGFNSRSRMGSDALFLADVKKKRSFNSRSRMGSDKEWSARQARGRVSIHAPAWGATPPEPPKTVS